MDTWIFMWFGPLERNTLHPRELLYCNVSYLRARVELARKGLDQTCGLPYHFRWPSSPFIAQGRVVTQRPGARQVTLRWLDPIQKLGYYWLGVVNDDCVVNIPSYSTSILHAVSSVESSCCITTVASTRGGQQPMVAGGWTVATWHVTQALLVVVASIRCIRPFYRPL
jgi:hypothetical protein